MAEKSPPPGVSQHPSAPKVPGYILTLPLARGASSEVWKAWQERTGKEVALKVLRDLSEEQRTALRASVERLIVLDRHPNVVAVLDADLFGEPAWVATDLLESGSLQARIDSGRPASADEAARWLEETARALAYVHGRGVFHGNLKPSNILLDEEGRPRLLDFGGGTDAASDGAALAVAVRAALGGAAADEDLEAVLAKCASPDPDGRYQSMAELAADLESRRKRFPVSPLASGRLYRAKKFLRRNGTVTALAATLAAAVVWGVVAVAARNAALTMELAGAYSQRARTALAQGDPAAAAVLFAKANVLHPSPAAQRDALAVLAGLDAPRNAWAIKAQVEAAAISPDGSRVLGVGMGEHGLFDTATGARLPFAKSGTMGFLIGPRPVAQFDAQGSRFLVGMSSTKMWLGDAKTGATVAEYESTLGALAPHGGLVAAVPFKQKGSEKPDVVLYDAATGKPTGVEIIHSPEGRDDFTSVAFNEDGRYLVTARHGLIRVWNAQTGRRVGVDIQTGGDGFLRVLGDLEPVFFTGNRLEIAVLKSGELRTFDADTGQATAQSMSHDGKVLSAAANSGEIVTGGEDGAVRRWVRGELRSNNLHPGLRHVGPVNAVAFSKDGTLVASGGEDGTVRLWTASSWGPHGRVLPHGSPVTSVAFSEDGRRLMTATRDGGLRLWDVPPRESDLVKLGNFNPVLSPDAKRVILGDSDTGVTLASLPDGAVLAKQMTGTSDAHTDVASFSRDGARVLLTQSSGDAAWVWDTAAGKKVAGPLAHPGKTGQKVKSYRELKADLSSDGSRAATAGGDGRVLLWDLGQGQNPEGQALKAHDQVSGLAFSPDGKRLAVLSYDNIEIWAVPPGPAPLLTVQKGGWEMIWTPDGRRLAVADGKTRTLVVWDTATGEPAGPAVAYADHTSILQASPDGRRLFVGFSDGLARLVDPENSEVIGPPMRHGGSLRAAAFTPDSAVIAAGGLDNTLYLWDAQSGEPVGRPLWLGRNASALVFSPDGGRLTTADWELREIDLGWLRQKEAPDALMKRAEATAQLRLNEKGMPRALGTDGSP